MCNKLKKLKSETADSRPWPCVHAWNRSLNFGSNLEPSLARVEHRVAVLNWCLSLPQLSDACPSKVS